MSNKKKLIPTLRFPEFKEDGEWEEKKLGEVSQPILEKTKGKKYTLMSITSGVGLVTQIEKFGREIAGQSYKNYYVLRRGDFAYNKSSTKLYPEGEIAVLDNIENGAVPNSIFTCFRFQETQVLYKFARYPFVNNLHGRWLKNYITVGARANGALQVNSKDFFSIPFPFPPLPEQQKIADCLSSLDDLLAAHNEKLELLKGHKKGLMQNLFPQEGERVPKFRFPEFENDGEWEEITLGNICNLVRGPFGGALKKETFVKEGYAVYEQSHAIHNEFNSFRYYIDIENFSKLKRFSVKPGDLIMSCSGTMGRFAIIQQDFKMGIINQALLKLTVKDHNSNIFVKFLMETENNQSKLLSQSAGGAIKNVVSVSQIKELSLLIPSIPEQQKIASCLSAVDDLIKAETEKIEALKEHKKGLMQGLFPKMEN